MKKYNIKILKEEIRSIDIIVPEEIIIEEIEEWAFGIEKELFENSGYFLEKSEELMGEKMVNTKIKLEEKYAEYEIQDITEIKKVKKLVKTKE